MVKICNIQYSLGTDRTDVDHSHRCGCAWCKVLNIISLRESLGQGDMVCVMLKRISICRSIRDHLQSGLHEIGRMLMCQVVGWIELSLSLQWFGLVWFLNYCNALILDTRKYSFTSSNPQKATTTKTKTK